jgi:hypothetical protein
MTIKKIVYCEVEDCDKNTVIGWNNLQDSNLQPPWVTVVVGSANWGRHFCGYAHLRWWADQQEEKQRQIKKPLENLPRDREHRFVKDPEKWDRYRVGAGGVTPLTCVEAGCDRTAQEEIVFRSVPQYYCYKHAVMTVVRLNDLGAVYTRRKL